MPQIKSWDFLPALEIGKVFHKKTLLVMHALMTRLACIYSKHAHAVQTGLCQAWRPYIAWQSFLESNFADFLHEVWVKIIQILSSHWWCFVISRYSNICYYCWCRLYITLTQAGYKMIGDKTSVYGKWSDVYYFIIFWLWLFVNKSWFPVLHHCRSRWSYRSGPSREIPRGHSGSAGGRGETQSLQ